MKKILPLIALIILAASCSTQKELSYLNNLDELGGENYFPMDVPDYNVQPRDILYVSVKAQTPEGALTEMLSDKTATNISNMANEGSSYLVGYSVDPKGVVTLPLIGGVPVAGLTVFQIRDLFQEKVDSLFRHAYVEVKLMSFKFTVIGEVRMPGSFVNYNDLLTVLEAEFARDVAAARHLRELQRSADSARGNRTRRRHIGGRHKGKDTGGQAPGRQDRDLPSGPAGQEPPCVSGLFHHTQ